MADLRDSLSARAGCKQLVARLIRNEVPSLLAERTFRLQAKGSGFVRRYARLLYSQTRQLFEQPVLKGRIRL